MSCCGNKKDVPPGSTSTTGKGNTLKAQKVYSNDNTIVPVPIAGFRPVPSSNVGDYKKITRQQGYGQERHEGSKSRLFGDDTTLNFELDKEPGVANTFDIPTFDYQTMLSHNIYFNLNSRSTLNVDDGNRSVLKQTNTQSPTKVQAK